MQFDFLIVGAGAAGCVLANRLSVDPAIKVMLLEAGADHPPGQEHPSILDSYPISLGHACFSWPDLTAEVGADLGKGAPRFSRRYLQGYGVGGSSNIQGMVALRGFPDDYEQWRDAGAAGWGWNDVLPYFKRLERDLDFDGPLHGQDGPIPIRRIKPAHWAPFSRAFADCVRARGFPLIEDLNADFRAGIGPQPMASLPHRRVSAAMGYLDESVRRRPNLTVLPNALVERIQFQGCNAVGVMARTSAGRESFTAHQIILCAGALHSPAILMRSGIGPGQHLQQHGIEVVCDLPAVGRNLMNHVGMGIAAHLPRHAVQPSTQRGHGQCCLRLSSGVEGTANDMILVAINKTAWHPLGQRIGALGVEVHKTHSRGEVRLRSADPDVAPEVKFNFLSDERDLARLLVGLKMCLEIYTDPRMTAVTNELFVPNAKMVQSLWERSLKNAVRASLIALTLEARPVRRTLLAHSRIEPQALLGDAAALREWALRGAGPPHHVSGTCRMGRFGDSTTVVDPECRVIGVDSLRVVDASIMPTLVRANTHIPVLMIAEKMADNIKADERAGNTSSVNSQNTTAPIQCGKDTLPYLRRSNNLTRFS